MDVTLRFVPETKIRTAIAEYVNQNILENFSDLKCGDIFERALKMLRNTELEDYLFVSCVPSCLLKYFRGSLSPKSPKTKDILIK